MWWNVTRPFQIATVNIRENVVVEQNEGEWIFWLTFKTKGKPPKKKLTVIGSNRTIDRAIEEKWLSPRQEPDWAKANYRPTAWEHLDADPFGAL